MWSLYRGQRIVGVLGMLGTDGISRVRRTGDAVIAGDVVDYAAVVPRTEDTEALLSANAWDGVRRYTSARQLYDLPLAVIVGLSEEEQLAAVTRQAHTYLWRAAGGSLLLVLLIGLLGRMSWPLAQSRLRTAEAQTLLVDIARQAGMAEIATNVLQDSPLWKPYKISSIQTRRRLYDSPHRYRCPAR